MAPLRNIWIVLATLPMVFFPGCEESLPPRSDPESVLVPAVSMTDVLVRVEAGEVTRGGNVELSMKNAYDDVLSESAGVKAYVRVTLQEYPSYTRLLVFNELDIATPGQIIGHTLTLGVNETIKLMQPWDHRVDSTMSYWNAGMTYQRFVTDKGVEYFESSPVHLIVDANLQIFQRVPAVQLPRQVFTIVYQLWRMQPPVTS